MKRAKGTPPKPPPPARRGEAGVASNRCKTVAGEFTLSFPVKSYLRFRGMGVSIRRRPFRPFFV
jgi:hypothetical protein